ncbi:hypothetical protein GCM10009678_77640 [Actinomadura kijaniata]|uniref:DUF5666 domain-containing protein n=1 Tax=Actinomadura namibiensis TaxID=182080 RepID=A0A7W3QLH7_ACTNM|nr:DUF5666 domain-containing protein [Actinomadura namibiensis]MBA8951492.1 hypothetical protein [Actinomadura namibiensis]
MGRKFITGVAVGATAAGIAGGIIAGVPALAADPAPSPTRSAERPHTERPHAERPGRGAFGALHGEFTVKDKDGRYVLRDVQRGQVTAVSETSLTVRSEDGTTWTWTVNGDTRVARNEKITSLKAGDTVRVAGTRSGETRTAAFVGKPPADGDRKKGDRRGHGHWRGDGERPGPQRS